MSREWTIVGLLSLFMMACQPGVPGRYIQPDDMEDILVDYHIARAMSENAGTLDGSGNYVYSLYLESVFQKHGVTRADFDSSLVYYYTRADRFEEICSHVSERLQDQALVMGASEGDIGVYASLDATGDTANVWTDRPQLVLLTVPPYNRRNIEVPIDSTFRQGDSFLFQFKSEFMYQDGMRSGIGYLAFQYTDTLITRTVRINTAGLNQLRISGHNTDLESISGYFFSGEGTERTSTTRILFLSNIQFIRFHEEVKQNETESQKDSLSSDSIPKRFAPDTVSIGTRSISRHEMVPVDTGISKYRMVER